MTKDQAAQIFGKTHADLARALEMTRGGISQWPDVLTEVQSDRVLGAAIRLGKRVPDEFLPPELRATRSGGAPARQAEAA